ncbi:MAG: hypothetical protein IJZ16_08940 [Clostridia bacterium]|nr:hypothetical protein [Clostridia bacterium]
MNENIVGAIITFVLGFAVAGLNFLLSRAILTKQPEKYAFSTILRQLIQILYIVAVYFVAEKTPWDMMYMLIGAVLGVTLPMFFFTQRLVKINDSMIKNRKEGDENG